METRQFLDRVLPDDGGDYFGAALNPSNKFLQTRLESVDALDSYIAAQFKKHNDVYFATGIYDKKREVSSTLLKKALYLDIDCGDGKEYATKKEALVSLYRLCKETNLITPTLLVDSGNGIHAYWTLDEPITLTEWKPLAKLLRQRCEEHDLYADHAITTDPARILRPIGTVNYKDKANPKPVTVLKSAPQDYTIQQVRASLVGKTSSAIEKLRGVTSEDDLGAGYEGAYVDTPRYAENMLRECQIMKHTLDTGGKDQQGMLWMRLLHVMAYTVDGHDFIHVLSEQHDEYDKERTEQRFAYALKKKDEGVGPTRCDTLEGFLPSKCAACRWRGHITTPLQVGKDASKSPPFGYKNLTDGLYKVISGKNEEGEDVVDWVRIFKFQVTKVEYFRIPPIRFEEDDPPSPVVRFRTLDKDNTSVTHTIDSEIIACSAASLGPALAKQDILLTNEGTKEFAKLMVSWVQDIKGTGQAETMYNSFGWHENQKEFVTKDQVYSKGAGRKARMSTGKIAKDSYGMKGTEDLWRELSGKLIAQDRYAITSLILSGFASPLIEFTNVKVCLLSVVSPESGAGKTTAIEIAQSVWGNPQKNTHALDDTVNSVIQAVGVRNSLPSYWDEVRLGIDPVPFMNMIFRLTQGKSKSRLTSSIKQRDIDNWKSMFVVASNMFLTDHMAQTTEGSDAGMVRIFEVQVPKLTNEKRIEGLDVARLTSNYGHIGGQYAKWLTDKTDAIDDVIERTYQSFYRTVDAKPAERFWVSTITTLYCAAAFANKLGFTKVNMQDYKEWLIEQYNVQRERVGSQEKPQIIRPAMELVEQYFNSNPDCFTHADKFPAGAGGRMGTIHIQARADEIRGIIGIKDKMLRLDKRLFKKWLYDQGLPSNTKIKELLVIPGASECRASVTIGVGNRMAGRTYCLDIPVPNDMLGDMAGSTDLG